MVAGPYDYEPGDMLNETKENFKIMGNKPTSLGTRIHQLALCVLYESPYSKVGGNVSDYLREPEYASFLIKIPTVWDETKSLKAKVADYAVMARKAENGDWYIGAVTDWTSRDIEIDFSFLPDDLPYQIEIYQDGLNADRYASDYKHMIDKITKSSKRMIHLAPGGGWVAKIFK
jgi:alpha-glucosidase